MTLRKPARNEMALMGLIALLLATIAVLPWQHFARLNSEATNAKYSFVNLRRPAPAAKPALWRAETVYSREHGTLRVHVTNRFGETSEGLLLRADFSTGAASAPAGGTLLRRSETQGVYRADNLRLGRGEWVIGLTGTRRSEFVFRIEQPVRID